MTFAHKAVHTNMFNLNWIANIFIYSESEEDSCAPGVACSSDFLESGVLEEELEGELEEELEGELEEVFVSVSESLSSVVSWLPHPNHSRTASKPGTLKNTSKLI